jgi:hypothetical protein
MTRFTKYLAGAGAAALMTVSAASPAQAQYVARDHYDRDRDNGIGLGEVAAGVAIIGGVALAIGALTSNNRSSRNYGYDQRYRGNYGANYGSAYGYGGERAALNACASVAQRYGQIERISDVDRRSNGSYRVRGRVLVRDYDNRRWSRGNNWDRETFTCYAQGNRVYDFRV